MASKNTEREKEKQDEITKEYLEAIKEVDSKYKRAFHPIIATLKDGSIVPRMIVVTLEEVEVNKK